MNNLEDVKNKNEDNTLLEMIKNSLTIEKITHSSNSNQEKKKRNKGKSLLKLIKDYTIIDIETTGLDSEYDSIIEISAIKVRDDTPSKEFTSLISISSELDPFITELTGISNEMLIKEGKDLKEVLKEFVDFIGNDILVGHNINFDINFLYDEILKNLNKELNNDFVDTLRMSKWILPDIDHHRLIDLLEHYNIKFENLHRGLLDCTATKEVYLKLKQDANNLGGEDFFKKANNRSYKASDFTTNNTCFNEDSLLFKKYCVFTGTLERMPRREAMQKVVDIGGYVQDDITKNTNYLIIGKADYKKTHGKDSSKIRKTKDMILKGKDIKILSENVFYDLLDENYIN